jgi:acyl-CoA thioester hydrolase/thioesterase-3
MIEDQALGGGAFSVFETELAVRPDDIDMNRHVHNSRYLDYVLAARFDQMERCYGMSMERFLAEGYSWFVRAAHIEHHRPLNLGDRMRVRTQVAAIGRREVKVLFEIYMLVDRDTGRPRTIPDEVRRKYSV